MDELKLIQSELEGIWKLVELGKPLPEPEINVYITGNYINFAIPGVSDRDNFVLTKEGFDTALIRVGKPEKFIIHHIERGKWMLWSKDSIPYLFYRLVFLLEGK